MKIKIIPIILMFALILSSCNTSATDRPDTTGEDDGIEYLASDVSGSNVTYLKTSAGLVPISLCDDGYGVLSGENYYYNIQNAVDNDLTLPDKTYTVFTDCGVNCGNVSFTDITDDKVKEQPLHALVTSGNWKLCPNMRKTTYAENTADAGYKQFILESFPDAFTSVDEINVTDVWEHDIDGDGSYESVVLANDDSYTVLAFLSSTFGNKMLASSFENDDGFIATPFIADFDGNGSYGLVTVCGNSLKTVTVYKENSLEPEYTIYLPITA